MGGSAPSAGTLYNYDTNRDAAPGIVIARGDASSGEGDSAKFQAWRSGPFASGANLPNSVTLKLWTAMKDFDSSKQGSMRVYLRDFSGSGYTTIAAAQITRANWINGSSTWQEVSVNLQVAGYDLAAGHQLELKVTVSSASSEDDIWFAYDTTAYPARIQVP